MEPKISGQLIVRALAVLQALNIHSFATLHELWLVTGIPKSTLHRILAILCEQAFVARDPARGVYRLRAKVRSLSDGYAGVSRVADLGAPILREVTDQIRWPLALGTLDGTQIVVRYSSMPFSAFAVHSTTVNNRHSLYGSAMGEAYLAACPDDERVTLLGTLCDQHRDDRSQSFAVEDVEAAIELTRLRGYGLRVGLPSGESTSIAVPVMAQGRVAAVLSLTMFRRSLTPENERRYPPILRDVARRVAEQLDR